MLEDASLLTYSEACLLLREGYSLNRNKNPTVITWEEALVQQIMEL